MASVARISKAICGLALAAASVPLAANPAWSANWQAIAGASSDHVRFYLDRASIRREGQWQAANVLYDFAEPQYNEEFGTYSKSYVVDSRIDCRGQRLAATRMRMYADHLGRGKPLMRTSPEKTLKWAPAASGPMNRAVIGAVCDRASQPSAKEASH